MGGGGLTQHVGVLVQPVAQLGHQPEGRGTDGIVSVGSDAQKHRHSDGKHLRLIPAERRRGEHELATGGKGLEEGRA